MLTDVQTGHSENHRKARNCLTLKTKPVERNCSNDSEAEVTRKSFLTRSLVFVKQEFLLWCHGMVKHGRNKKRRAGRIGRTQLKVFVACVEGIVCLVTRQANPFFVWFLLNKSTLFIEPLLE
jgi:hypothetical protein